MLRSAPFFTRSPVPISLKFMASAPIWRYVWSRNAGPIWADGPAPNILLPGDVSRLAAKSAAERFYRPQPEKRSIALPPIGDGPPWPSGERIPHSALSTGAWPPELERPRPSPPLHAKLRPYSITRCAMDWTTATQVLTTTSSATVIGCSSNYILVLQNSALLYKLQRVFFKNPNVSKLWTNLCVSNSTANDMSNVSFIAANFMMATFIAKRIKSDTVASKLAIFVYCLRGCFLVSN